MHRHFCLLYLLLSSRFCQTVWFIFSMHREIQEKKTLAQEIECRGAVHVYIRVWWWLCRCIFMLKSVYGFRVHLYRPHWLGFAGYNIDLWSHIWWTCMTPRTHADDVWTKWLVNGVTSNSCFDFLFCSRECMRWHWSRAECIWLMCPTSATDHQPWKYVRYHTLSIVCSQFESTTIDKWCMPFLLSSDIVYACMQHTEKCGGVQKQIMNFCVWKSFAATPAGWQYIPSVRLCIEN